MQAQDHTPDAQQIASRDRRYAAIIWQQVQKIKGQPYHTKYGGLTHELPVLIRSAGLAQALAFMESRRDEACNQLLTDLAVAIGLPNGTTLVSQSRAVDLPEYMWLTRQTLAALRWYKRFAQSVLDVSNASQLGEMNERTPR